MWHVPCAIPPPHLPRCLMCRAATGRAQCWPTTTMACSCSAVLALNTQSLGVQITGFYSRYCNDSVHNKPMAIPEARASPRLGRA